MRLTASTPFRIGADGQFIETQDVYLEVGRSTPAESVVYRVQVSSFPSRSGAEDFRAALGKQDDIHDELWIRREDGSGRFAVRLGAFAGESSASARLESLRLRGYEGLSLVREPTRSSRPHELLLHPVGQPTLPLAALSLLALPGESGGVLEVDGRPYRGYVEVFVNRTNLFTIVNVVHLEDYLKGVVPAELSPEAFPQKEAIKAQALAARTYAVKRLGQFSEDGYDICATPACQVYRGVSVEHPMATEAILETRGEVLTYRGELVDALYTSTCGGRTENSENVFSTAFPYLVSRACFLESRGGSLETSPALVPASLETATLRALDVLRAEPSSPDASVSLAEAAALLGRTLTHLGQSSCLESPTTGSTEINVATLARLVGEGLCWQRRLQFLVSDADVRRLVPNVPGSGISAEGARYLAFALREGIVEPPPEGLARGGALGRRDLHRAMYRLLERGGDTLLRPATVIRVGPGRVVLRDDTLSDRENEIVTGLAPTGRLFRRAGDRAYFAPEVVLLPGDRVEILRGDRGLEVLVLISEGASFDRSSRMSHWTVRKSSEELSASIGRQHGLGLVRDLRPIRYGRSGRIIELTVVGTESSVDLKGLAIRRALGIRENLFFLDVQRGPDGHARSWVFTGRGWGHGVGLCQVGAYGMAATGFGYRQILAHYYPGTKVVSHAGSARLDVDKLRHAP